MDLDFVIDTAGNSSSSQQDANAAIKEILAEYKESLNASNKTVNKKKPDIFNEFYNEMGWTKQKQRGRAKIAATEEFDKAKKEVNELLKKSVITPEFEQLKQVPPYQVSEKKLKLQRRQEREKTKGAKWFGLPATELTEEVKHDLEVLQMRSVLDPKRFYKKNDLKVIPKYFQIGKVVDSPLDFYNNRMTRKERKKTLVDELLADAEFSKYNKRKYKEIIEEKQRTHYKAWRQAKKLKRKNK